MNKLFLFVMVILTITITSCTSESESELRTFTYAEMMTLVAIEKATITSDSLYLKDINENTIALPIVKVGEVGYYPVCEGDAFIYYPVEYYE